jgi:hypothetical protein
MSQSTFIPLEDVRVASPCRADWELMQGDDRVRFCQTCAKNVYNLSEMSRVQAENLIAAKEGNLCVRFYQRADGTVLTDNCPVGLKLVRRPFQWLAASFAALLLAGVGIVRGQEAKPACPNPGTANATSLRDMQPFKWAMERLEPQPVNVIAGGMTPPPIMGKPAPSPTPVPKATAVPKNIEIEMGEIALPPAPVPEPKK